MDDDDTLSLERWTTSDDTALPQLFVVLQCDRPTQRGIRVGLGGVEEVVLGRGPAAVRREDGGGVRRLVVTVPDHRISGRHARVRREGEQFLLEDTSSKNGSFVNGQAAERVVLADQDLIQLGCTFFTFRRTGREYPAAPALDAACGTSTLLPDLAARFGELERVARSTVPILVLGETGTGKELVTRTIHRLSGRPGPLIAVNCGALPSTLVEGELFGHRRGAFSGAVGDRTGLVRASDGGSLFLDEIGDFPLGSQPALLRVLQEREVVAVGDTRPAPVDLRVISATHRDLSSLEAAGLFRADLRARLAGYTIRLPPLRDRREDIGLFLPAFLEELAGERAGQMTLSPELGQWLLTYRWPLNIRELRQLLAATVALGRPHLHAPPAGWRPTPPRQVLEARPAPDPAGLSAAERDQRQRLVELLCQHRGNISAVARELGKERIQIRRWIRRYGLRLPDLKADSDGGRPSGS